LEARADEYFVMAFDLDHALRYLIAAEGSDLHLKVPSYPLIRLHGSLEPIPGTERLFPEDTRSALNQMLEDADKLAEFDAENEVDFSYSVEGLGRFRVNAFLQRGSVSIVMRAIPVVIKSVDELGLPEAVTKLANEQRGIVLLTGTTGSGKSTTLAAMIDHINTTSNCNIISLEDPIEFVHASKRSQIVQRELGTHIPSFAEGVRASLREDPDVILVGELRDGETISMAMTAAETGHLVLGTLHTTSAVKSVDRIIDALPAEQREQTKSFLAHSLHAVVTQTLVKTPDNRGRRAIVEILIMNRAIAKLIMTEQTHQIPAQLQTGKDVGMQLMDQALLDAIAKKTIDPDDAYRFAGDRKKFERFVTDTTVLPSSASVG